MNGQAKVKGWCNEEDSLISWVNNFSKKKKDKQYLQNSNESNSKLEHCIVTLLQLFTIVRTKFHAYTSNTYLYGKKIQTKRKMQTTSLR
jgi:hypothetical protein